MVFHIMCLACICNMWYFLLPQWQLIQALREIEEVKLEMMNSQENWEHEKLRLKEEM